MKKVLVLCLLVLVTASCAKKSPPLVQIPEPLEESKTPTVSQRNDGSLWNGGSTSLFSDHKAKMVGDIVTVTISETATASKEATTSTGRSTSMSASIPNLLGLENAEFVDNSHLDLANLVSANFENSFDGSGRTVRNGNLTASLTTQVIQVYKNGNFKIRGGKEVMLNDEIQVIYLTGIIRPVDITAANTVDSVNILNARISYTGRGAIDDKQHPGWAMRALDHIWPF